MTIRCRGGCDRDLPASAFAPSMIGRKSPACRECARVLAPEPETPAQRGARLSGELVLWARAAQALAAPAQEVTT